MTPDPSVELCERVGQRAGQGPEHGAVLAARVTRDPFHVAFRLEKGYR